MKKLAIAEVFLVTIILALSSLSLLYNPYYTKKGILYQYENKNFCNKREIIVLPSNNKGIYLKNYILKKYGVVFDLVCGYYNQITKQQCIFLKYHNSYDRIDEIYKYIPYNLNKNIIILIQNCYVYVLYFNKKEVEKILFQ